ncbi:hypothetical protein V8E52_010790 [Russula decolorans]
MPDLLTESTLRWYNLANDLKDHKTGLPELHRVEMWITSLASRRSAAGLKGRSSVTRPRATSVSSASSIALTLATVCTNAESQMSKGFADRRGGLEEEEGDEKCEHPSQHPSQDRGTLGKRARKMAGSRAKKTTSVPRHTKKPRLELERSKRRTKDTDSDDSDLPSQANEGIVWKYGGFIDSDEDEDCEYRAILLGETNNVSMEGPPP